MTFSTLESSVLMSSASSYKTAASGCERQNILHILAAPMYLHKTSCYISSSAKAESTGQRVLNTGKQHRILINQLGQQKQDRPTFGFTSGAARDKREYD
ncbi:hypothetical protein BaRGS_00011747 [Batillaria attramentaria]|uniref:Uncharacterized protein n=1 Tax=Batillaria attramentaria TaxID=370345 RepID=A0ABD0LCZ5_9CAEN